MSSFGKAFAAARKAGKKNFTFGGKSYHTKTKEEMAPPIPKDRPERKGGSVRVMAVTPTKSKAFTKGGNAGDKLTTPFTKGGNAGNKSTVGITKGGNSGNKSKAPFTKGGNAGQKIAPSEDMSALGIKLNVKKKSKAKLHQ